MSARKLLLWGAALLQVQLALSAPVADTFSTVSTVRQSNVAINPPANSEPVVIDVPEGSEQELLRSIDELESLADSSTRVEAREVAGVDSQTTEGALRTFISGDFLPGTKEATAGATCTDWTLNGPFISLHFKMGTSHVRNIWAKLFSNEEVIYGNTADEIIMDAGLFTFDTNEKITKFSVARWKSGPGVRAFRFETDAGQTYAATSGVWNDTNVDSYWTDLDVASGVLARIRGTYCTLGVMGSVGFDFLEEIDSIGITNIKYAGFTDNIMPTEVGTPLSVGTQILDNRNSSEKQTITLTTQDAVTRSTSITTQRQTSFGNGVTVKSKVGIPFLSESEASTEVHWEQQFLNADTKTESFWTTRAGQFALACAPFKFCTARAFFTQYKLDVEINATMTAFTVNGGTWDWVQSGTYKGADSLAMEYNITQTDSET